MKLKDFSNGLKFLQGIIPGGLLLSVASKPKFVLYFPPLGNHEPSHRLLASALLTSAALLPYFLPQETKRWRWLIVVCLACLMILDGFIFFNQEDKLTTTAMSVNVTIGSERKPDLLYEDLPAKANPLLACAFKTAEATKMRFTQESYRNYLEQVLGSLSDSQLIRCSGGTDDEHLESIYVKAGLHANRTKLFCYYLLWLLPLELMLGTIARSDDIHS